MSYSHLLARLFQVNLFGGVKLGLSNALQLQKLLDYPDQHFSVIHVAGTNGKGSVCTKIAEALQAAGYRVGLYTSPHISCFRERIRVNGTMITEKEVEKHLSFLFDLVHQHHISATFFELTTLLSFMHFAEQKIDVAILETGLGGRLDATNIVSPLLSVITSISFDHTEILGSSLEAIANEKAGIIKPYVPILVGPRVPRTVLQMYATSMQAPFHQVEDSFSTYEEENRAVAHTALQQLSSHFHLSKENILCGLEKGQPCRFEVLEHSCPIILDVAHNPDGLHQLFVMVQRRFPHKPLHIVCGLSKNKDIVGCLQQMLPYATRFYLVESYNGRGVAASLLAEKLIILGVSSSAIQLTGNIATSIQAAVQQASLRDEIVLVCGTFFIMSQARQALGFQEPSDPIDLNERNISKNLSL